MKSRKCLAALFDLDGVVFDTEPQYTVFWGNQFRKYYPGSEEMEQKIKGQTLVQIFDGYFPDQGDRETITRELDLYEQGMSYEYVKGFEKFIGGLRAAGVKTAVVTSSNVAKMEKVYQKRPEFKSFFDEILTSEDFAASKPSPDCYQKAAQRFGFSPMECVVLEDSINGLKSGRAADMFVVGLSTTNAVDAIAPLADIVIPDYEHFDYEKINRIVQASH